MPVTVDRRLRAWRAIERCATDPRSDSVTLTQLSLAAGVSLRTLNSVSHEFSGQPAKTYIRQRRMALARALLSQADPANCTVTQVATFCGFEHFGRFSGTFRNHHGELPSSVLRRRAA